jgi:hypothetical protein
MTANPCTPVLLVALCVVAAWAPAPVHAASYKCVVDGKTTYQGQPCAEQPKSRDAASVPATPPAAASGGYPGATRQDPARRDGATESAPEPMAREAFAAMKGGNIGAYGALLCPKPRAALSGKGSTEEFKSDGQGFTRSRTDLGKAVVLDREGVTFQATDAATTTGKDAKSPRTIRVHFDWVDGKPCVTRIDGVTRIDRR